MTTISKWIDETPQDQVLPLVTKLLRGFRFDSDDSRPIVSAIQRQIDKLPVASAVALVELLPNGATLQNQAVVEQLIGDGNYGLLAKLQLSESQARELAGQLTHANAAELPDLLTAVSSAQNDRIDLGVLRRLYGLPTARTLGEHVLGNLYRNRSTEIRNLAQETNEILQASPKNVRETVSRWLTELPEGDAVRGLQVFRSQKTNCNACHQMGYLGGQIGPELTRIGRSRTKEALLEAILFPSARIEQSFKATKLLTLDGMVINGLVTKRTDKSLELQIAAEKKIRVNREDIDFQEPSELSIMPAGIQDVLSKQELADLLALLENAN